MRSNGLLGAVLLAAVSATAVQAKPARCFSTDDGYYACNFTSLDRSGSFRISAAGYPTYTFEVEDGFAFVVMRLSGRSVPLPGQYVRSRDDGACWQNPETDTKICAW